MTVEISALDHLVGGLDSCGWPRARLLGRRAYSSVQTAWNAWLKPGEAAPQSVFASEISLIKVSVACLLLAAAFSKLSMLS